MNSSGRRGLVALAAEDGKGRVLGEPGVGLGLSAVEENRPAIVAVLLAVAAGLAEPDAAFLAGIHVDTYTMKAMACRGVHFALAEDDVRRLLAADGNEAVRSILLEIEKRGDKAWLSESGRAWDALHRSLSNGSLYYDEGEYPLNRAVLGGKHLVDGDDTVVSYVPPKEVKDVAAALAPLTEAAFRVRYDAIDPDDYDGEHGDEDFKRTWETVQSVRDLYKKAAADGRAVVFTVDP